MSAVLALIIVVAAFTVVATLVMVVLEKKKEVAVLKAMGATDWAILRIFLYQGGIIGLVGTTLGLLVGVAVCKGLLVYGFPLDPKVYFISRLPVQVRPQEFLVTGLIALVICLEGTIVPSLYAANMLPAEGFREQSGSGETTRSRSSLLTVWLYLIHFVSMLALLPGGIALLASGIVGAVRDLNLGAAGTFAVVGGVGLLTVAVPLFSAACALALLLWKRWGFYGICALLPLTFGSLFLTVWKWFAIEPRFAIAVGVVGVLFYTVPLVVLRNRYWRYLD
jgi:lipoprotein-releasing system permease protein